MPAFLGSACCKVRQAFCQNLTGSTLVITTRSLFGTRGYSVQVLLVVVLEYAGPWRWCISQGSTIHLNDSHASCDDIGAVPSESDLNILTVGNPHCHTPSAPRDVSVITRRKRFGFAIHVYWQNPVNTGESIFLSHSSNMAIVCP